MCCANQTPIRSNPGSSPLLWYKTGITCGGMEFPESLKCNWGHHNIATLLLRTMWDLTLAPIATRKIIRNGPSIPIVGWMQLPRRKAWRGRLMVPLSNYVVERLFLTGKMVNTVCDWNVVHTGANLKSHIPSDHAFNSIILVSFSMGHGLKIPVRVERLMMVKRKIIAWSIWNEIQKWSCLLVIELNTKCGPQPTPFQR